MDVDSWTDCGAFRDGHPKIEEDSIQHLFFLTSMTYLLSIPFTIMTCLKLMGELDAAWKLVFIPVWIWMLPLPIIVFFELYFIDIPDPVHNAGNILFRVMRSRLSVRRFYLRRMRTLLWTVVQLVSTWVGLIILPLRLDGVIDWSWCATLAPLFAALYAPSLVTVNDLLAEPPLKRYEAVGGPVGAPAAVYAGTRNPGNPAYNTVRPRDSMGTTQRSGVNKYKNDGQGFMRTHSRLVRFVDPCLTCLAVFVALLALRLDDIQLWDITITWPMVFAPLWAANVVFIFCILHLLLTYGLNFAPLPEGERKRRFTGVCGEQKGAVGVAGPAQAVTLVFTILVMVPTVAFEVMLFNNIMDWTNYSFVELFMPYFVIQGFPWALVALAMAGACLYGFCWCLYAMGNGCESD